MSRFILLLLSLMIVSSAQAGLNIEQWKTAQGARVLYAYAPELPMVDVRIVFDAGSARDNDKKGVAYLTNTLIGMGDTQRDEEQFSQETEALGVRFSTQSLKDMALVSMRSLTKPSVLDAALSLSAAALDKPVFKEAVLAREQAQLLTALQAKQQSPSAVANELFWKRLYGDHPYAFPTEGNAASVKTITVADIKQFYERFYTAKNAVVAIVGDVDRAKAEEIATKMTEALPTGEAAPALPAVNAPKEKGIESIAFPATQTQILIGQLGIARDDPDYVALYLANHILGGSGFASRLMEEVREKRGLVYGVSANLIPMHQLGPWYVSLQTATNNAKEALKVTQETVAGLLKSIPQSEIDAHKDNIIGGFALETDSNKDIVGYLAMMGFYHLPDNWLATFPDKIRAINRDQLIAVVNKRLKPLDWTGIILGKQADTNAIVTPIAVPPMSAGGHH
ncbi:MAG: insulinase family protein [Thiotrichales bacterium]|jgi:zinc protease|nr:insulinase family protein [Thiotrichales bacterium]